MGADCKAISKTLQLSLNNFFNGGGTLTPNFLTIFGLTGGNLTTALSQLSGEAATDGQTGAFQMMTQFLTLMLDPSAPPAGQMAVARSFCSGAGGEFPARHRTRLCGRAQSAAEAGHARPTLGRLGLGLWRQQSNGWRCCGGHQHVTARAFGFAGGMDYHFTPDTVAGFALAGGGTNWGLAQVSAAAAVMRSRLASTARPVKVQPMWQPRWPSPTTG